ncbi:MAG TPA: hypothetical protein VLW50_13420, partial [Streptosporangiaceae bacterium]|nr:hypothetical protein [Streptosporangiaceae bacterium]
YLHRLDRAWDDGDGALARFADDLVVMCWSRRQAERALERLTGLLAGLGLEPKAAKTRIVHLQAGGEGVRGISSSAIIGCVCTRRSGTGLRKKPTTIT